MAAADDAGVYRLPGGPAVAQTVDFFTPVVDEPYDWGRAAAANSLSDVYAMGGRPLTALQLAGWPRDDLPWEMLEETMAGGADVMAEAGTTVLGGHSIDNPTPLYGFAVTGLVDPELMTAKRGARPGDAVVLTKPLGTGVAATAIRRGKATEALREAAVGVMTSLNGPAAQAMTAAGVKCATDVTGFGLLGHLREIILASGAGARIRAESVPVLDGIAELVEEGVYPGGSERNLEAVRGMLTTQAGETQVRILADAQTSGGLLMAVPPGRVGRLMERLAAAAPQAAVIGEFTDGPGMEVL